MSIQFFSRLSQNYIEILEDNEYYDTTIEVGKDPNNNDVLAHIKLPNILPKTFQIILRYLYGGILSLNGQDTLDIIKVLIGADELLLHELLYKDLLNSYMDPDIEPNDSNIPLPRNLKISDDIESNIVNLNIISIISRWTDKVDYNISGTEEILGGYNPSIWESSNSWSRCYYNFIFSFKSKNEIKGPILSCVKNMDNALYYHPNYDPTFGNSDLRLSGLNQFNYNWCKQTNYEKRIRDTEDKFNIEDYEVFQITKK
ncbi:BTB/POZ protein [Rhizophagus irregularis DAOM 181602=DAOM 197198]|nr:BTB/POZ protein [Rhizophagus irregularis DAOM 181602=DAOM 197198]